MPNTDYKKITQSLNYFTAKAPDRKLNKLKVIKLVWIADRYHLRKYGRPITWDMYEAMPLGPVGSSTKDIAEQSAFLEPREKDYSSSYVHSVDAYTIESIKDPDTSVFSTTDIEALDFALSNYGDWQKYKLKDYTHLYPEWKKFEEILKNRISLKERMDYMDFFKNPDGLENDPFYENEGILESSKQIFIENRSILRSRSKVN